MTRLLNWFRRQRLESGLDRELAYHLDRRTLDLQQSGLPESEARRRAKLELGGVTRIQEEVRDVWLTQWFRDFKYDLRFSLRSFVQTPTFTITAVISLMLGIGATAAIYSLVDQVLLHRLPVYEPERLVLIDWDGEAATTGFGSWNLMSYPICRDLDRQREFFDGVFCRALTTLNLSTSGDHQPTEAEIVSGNYFQVLGVRAEMGRIFSAADDGEPNANPVAVLSYGFWKKQLGGAPDVVGRKVMVNGHPMVIVGVAAPTFQGIDIGSVPALWIPASMAAQAIPGFNDYLDRRTVWMQVLGRLRPAMTWRKAQIGLQPWFKAMLHEDTRRPKFPVLTPQLRRAYFESKLVLSPAPQGHSELRRQLVQPLWVLFGITAVLLGLACLNVAGLFLARGSAREREISARLALGASRGRIGRQLLVDSLLIAFTGGLLGTALAPIVVRILIAFVPHNTAANALRAGLDSRLLLFATAATITAGVLSGLTPAWQAGRGSIVASLRERAASAIGSIRLRKLIVTVQIGLTLILVVGAALFIRTLDVLVAKGPGFATSSLVTFGIDPSRSGYSNIRATRLIRNLNEAIRNSPITQMSAVARWPLLTGGSWNNHMTIQGRERVSTDRLVNQNSVSPGFFKTLGIRMVASRNFDERDTRSPGKVGERSAIVNEAFVKRYLHGQTALGVRICLGSGPDAKPNIPIVGVVSDFAYRDLRENSEQAYFSFLEGESSGGNFYVRVRGTPEEAFRTLRSIVHKADPSLPMIDFTSLAMQVDRSLLTERLLAMLSGGFGVLALLLSLVGLYGVLAFVVVQRTREIGIRVALGAERNSTIWLIVRDALVMVFWGIAIGLPFVWMLGRLVESQVFGVKAFDPMALTVAILVLSVAAITAAYLPARRAAAVNPTDALRAE